MGRRGIASDVGGAVTRVSKGLSGLTSRKKQRSLRVALGLLRHRIRPKLGAVTKPLESLAKEAELSPVLHEEVAVALKRMQQASPELTKAVAQAYAYAVFPEVGKASAVLGVAYGRGEVFEHGRVVGYAGVVQLTVGVQVGGQAFDEVVVFADRDGFERFKRGKIGFAANASAVMVKAGVAASKGPPPAAKAFVSTGGGMMLELALGGQKFIFRPAVIGRGRSVDMPQGEQQDAAGVNPHPDGGRRGPAQMGRSGIRSEMGGAVARVSKGLRGLTSRK